MFCPIVWHDLWRVLEQNSIATNCWSCGLNDKDVQRIEWLVHKRSCHQLNGINTANSLSQFRTLLSWDFEAVAKGPHWQIRGALTRSMLINQRLHSSSRIDAIFESCQCWSSGVTNSQKFRWLEQKCLRAELNRCWVVDRRLNWILVERKNGPL